MEDGVTVGPYVVSVSEFRRRLADLIEEVGRREQPLFIMQHGFVTAVLISPEQYRERSSAEEQGRRALCGPERDGPPTAAQLAPRRSTSQRQPDSTLMPTRGVWTQYGWLDFELAQVLAEQGVETELIPTDEGWLTDDEG
jgi:prevent-host-death family protein